LSHSCSRAFWKAIEASRKRGKKYRSFLPSNLDRDAAVERILLNRLAVNLRRCK
jgi:hypothetical protein